MSTPTGAGEAPVDVPVVAAQPAGPGKGLGATAARGAAVTLTGQGLRIVVQVVGVVVLSRLLSPADYGLLAMTTAVVGVADIFRDMGLSSAAVQARTLSRGQRANLFWLNSGIGLLLSLVVFAGAPLLALVYSRPELVDVTRVLCWTFLLNGLATQYRADMLRSLRFTRLAVVDVLAPVTGLAVGIAAATQGAGVFALVVQQLTQYTVVLVALAVAAGWFPGRPDRSAPMGGLLRFGWQLVGSQLVGYAGNNVDSLTIGIRFGAEPLGLYNRAFQLLMTPLNQIRGPITQVGLPLLSRMQDDRARLGSALVRGQAALGLTLMLGLGVLAGAAVPATALLLGDQWQAAAPLLALLAVAGAFQSLGLVSYWAYLSLGMTGPLLKYSFIQAAVRVVLVLAGSTVGVVGVAAGYAAAPVIGVGLSYWWLGRYVDLPLRALYAGAARSTAVTLVAGAATAGVAWWAADLPAVLTLLLCMLAGVATAGLVAALWPQVRTDLRGTVQVVRSALTGRGRTR